ncbi:LOW QUALITY PROTEIN: hypothetical protein PanWU01x14_083700 [Parasponia andersonii]|uniref:Uncharacterized protein n=1 Tax=Parasponia andersonii TaxID=3476 RepID=A0A2P5D9F8_PARAD|nr:LOW QUALITY PROTEIN: hypothetical protein PanWU01x14_083700 [Parasponia andersonii]
MYIIFYYIGFLTFSFLGFKKIKYLFRFRGASLDIFIFLSLCSSKVNLIFLDSEFTFE